VLRNKTDRTDTDAMLEAFRNEGIRPVPIKSVTQQVLGTLHRLRSGWLGERTGRINALRGLLRGLGLFIPVGRKLAPQPVFTPPEQITLVPCPLSEPDLRISRIRLPATIFQKTS
jgi:transposase